MDFFTSAVVLFHKSLKHERTPVGETLEPWSVIYPKTTSSKDANRSGLLAIATNGARMLRTGQKLPLHQHRRSPRRASGGSGGLLHARVPGTPEGL